MTEELVSKIGAKSVVWDYFGFRKDSEGKLITDDGCAICRTCRGRVKAKYGNTSNLLSHLKTNHPIVYQEAMKSGKTPRTKATTSTSVCGQSTIQETIERTQKYERKGKKWKELTDSITHCIAKDCLPINIVEGVGFKKMIHAFDSRYELPSRNHFSRIALPALCVSVKQTLKQDISTQQYFSATTDMWSSVGMQPYMSYTIHYIDGNWEFQNKCLQTQFLPEDHTGIHLAEAMEAALGLWELDPINQVCLTTDNGSNIISATGILDWSRLSCFGHNLHLSITKAIKDDARCSRALGVCRKIVSSFSMSWKRKKVLTKTQINLNLTQHSLIADCPTRWGSMAKMVSRILEQKEAIRLVLSADRSTSNIMPTWQDLDVLQAIDKAISPLSSLTDILSGEQYVTVSAVLPMLHILETDLLKVQETDTQLTKDIQHRIVADIKSRYTESKLAENVILMLQVASFLDPRFKTKYMEHLGEINLINVKQKVLDKCMSLTYEEATAATRSASEPVPPAPKKRNLGTLFKDHETRIREEEQLTGESTQVVNTEEQQRQQATKEVDDYLSASRLDFEEDPLLWWKGQPLNYPILQKVAQKYLCVCATSSASERLFSTAGNIVSSFRSTLKPDKVDMLVFLSKNL